MIRIVEKKVFHQILDMGFESVAIPVRVKFEFEVQEGSFVKDSLTVETLYNRQAVVKRYPGVKKDELELRIQDTVQHEIDRYLKDCGYL
jgi:hypothetical protein